MSDRNKEILKLKLDDIDAVAYSLKLRNSVIPYWKWTDNAALWVASEIGWIVFLNSRGDMCLQRNETYHKVKLPWARGNDQNILSKMFFFCGIFYS